MGKYLTPRQWGKCIRGVAYIYSYRPHPLIHLLHSVVGSYYRQFQVPADTLKSWVHNDTPHCYNLQEIQTCGISAADRWCWQWLGKDIRVVLSSCAVTISTFSSVSGGFKFPDLL